MQRLSTKTGDDDAFFGEIDFERVYHEGPFDPMSTGGAEIVRARNAEVLAISPLTLEDSLVAIMCRSPSERATLLHMAGSEAAQEWASRVRVFTKPGIFFNEWAFVESVNGAPDSVTVGFHSRALESAPVRLTIRSLPDPGLVYESESELLNLGGLWEWKVGLEDGLYLCRIHLHDCLGHEAPFLIDALPF